MNPWWSKDTSDIAFQYWQMAEPHYGNFCLFHINMHISSLFMKLHVCVTASAKGEKAYEDYFKFGDIQKL